MKLIQILNQFFTIRGELGTKFCVSADSDRNNNVTRVEYICVTNTKKLPADWQSVKKRHATMAISKIVPYEAHIDGLGMAYNAAATAVQVLNTVVPDSMGEEVHNALANLKKAVGDVSGFVAERLHFSREELAERLAAEQVDAVALSIYNIEARQQGFIIGDQTGVGKGRIAAAMIRYAIVQGHTPVFITEKPNLFTDFYRDLNDIGCAHYKPFIVNAKESKSVIKDSQGAMLYEPDDAATQQKIIKSGKVPEGYDFVMATYSQFSDKEITDKKSFLLQLAENNILVLDEAHNAGGSVGRVVDGKQSGGSNTATFFLTIVKKVKGIVFLSATFAKRPDNMPLYCVKTCIGETSLPVDKLVDAITKGGVALQEVLSANVVKEGQMLRREKSKDQIVTNYITLDKDGKAKFGVEDVEKQHRAMLDSVTELMRDIIYFQNDYVAPIIDNLNKIYAAQQLDVEMRKGTEGLGIDNQPFASKTFQIISQLLFSIKSREVANRAVWNLQHGKKVVLAFANTMEAMINNLGAKEGDNINPDYSISLLSGLDSVLRYTVKDDTGTATEYKMISLDELGEEGAKFYTNLKAKIRRNVSSITISPIDVMKDVIEKAGFSVIEVTGRKFQLNFNKDYTKATVAARKKENTADAFRRFQNNECDVLFINTSGSTGASAHAIPTKTVKPEQVKQRVMIIAQPELNISTEVQKRGRIDRTGQIYPPIYEYISSAIPAERRLMMMLQKKLKSLDANTTSNQKQSKNVVEYDDFLNKYGDEVVVQYLKENEEVNEALNDPLDLQKANENDKKSDKTIDAANKITGRVAVLKTTMQDEFYDTVLEMYKNHIDYKIQAGEYDLEVETMPLQAETIEKRATIAAKGEGKSVFSAPTYEEVCMVNVLKKPYTKAELDKEIKTAKSKDIDNEQIALEYKNAMLAAYAKREAQINEKWDKVIKNIHNEKGYKETTQKLKYQQDREKEIAEAREKDIQREKDKSQNQFGSIEPLIRAFTVGSAWNFAFGDMIDMTNPAVCLGVTIDSKSKNPYAPSNMFVSFAVSDSTRLFKLNFASEQRQSLLAIRSANRWQFQNNLVENWEEWTKKRSANREKRIIVTGNILQAFDREDYAKGGKLVSFTRKNGDVDKGILLRRDIGDKLAERNEKHIASVNVPIEKARDIILKLSENQGVQCSGKVTIFKSWNREYRIFTAGSSKQEFEWLITNDKLIELAQSDYGFQIARSQWNATFSEKDMPLVLDVLQELGVNVRIEGDAAEKLQKELAKENAGGNWKRLSWNENNIPKSSKTAKSAKSSNNDEAERIRIAEAEAEAMLLLLEMEEWGD